MTDKSIQKELCKCKNTAHECTLAANCKVSNRIEESANTDSALRAERDALQEKLVSAKEEGRKELNNELAESEPVAWCRGEGMNTVVCSDYDQSRDADCKLPVPLIPRPERM